jgi:hypothetical protein
MIRDEEFRISRRPYAVDLSSLRLQHEAAKEIAREYWRGSIDAVWFRRRDGITVACIGSLWDYQDIEPADGEAFLRAHKDGRYGGSTVGRWDGSGYWGHVSLDEQNAHLAILQPMLENFPAVPPGYDGWWRF